MLLIFFVWQIQYACNFSNCYSRLFHSFIPLPCAECDNSLPFSGASSIPLCYVLFPATLLHQLFFHPLSPHLAIYFLVFHSSIHSIGTRRMRRFLVLRSFFHPSLLFTLSFNPFPPTILPSSLTSSCHLFLGLPLNLAVPKFIYNTLLWILFPSILCTCPNQCNLFNLIVSILVGFLTL